MNKVLTWLVIVLLIGGEVATYTKLQRVETTLSGTILLMALTNESAKSFVKDVLPATKVKDKDVRDRLIKQQAVQHFGSELTGRLGIESTNQRN